MRALTSAEEVDAIEGEALILFCLHPCPPCEDMKRRISENVELGARTHVLVFDLDSPWHKDLVRKFRISVYPTAVFVRGREVLNKLAGAAVSIDVPSLARTVFAA